MMNVIIVFFTFALVYGAIASTMDHKPPETEAPTEEHKQALHAKDTTKVKQLTDITNKLLTYIYVTNVSSPQADRGGEWFITVSLLDGQHFEIYYNKNMGDDITEYLNDEFGLSK